MFDDVDALGLFVDNHDNPRFLNSSSPISAFKNALVFSLTASGIPIYYYGSEQAFHGGKDPDNRESLWQSMNTSSDIYQMTASVNEASKEFKLYKYPMQELAVEDDVYAFKRGDLIVVLTNTQGEQNLKIQSEEST